MFYCDIAHIPESRSPEKWAFCLSRRWHYWMRHVIHRLTLPWTRRKRCGRYSRQHKWSVPVLTRSSLRCINVTRRRTYLVLSLEFEMGVFWTLRSWKYTTLCKWRITLPRFQPPQSELLFPIFFHTNIASNGWNSRQPCHCVSYSNTVTINRYLQK